MGMPAGIKSLSPKSKLVLILLQYLGGLCGVDRCYLADFAGPGCCLGITKGLTLGGLGFWVAFDTAIIFVNGIEQKGYMDTCGMHARFNMDEVSMCYWLSWLGVLLMICNCICGCMKSKAFWVLICGC